MFSKLSNMSGSNLICVSRGNFTFHVGSSHLKGGGGSLLKYARNGHDDQGQQQLRLGEKEEIHVAWASEQQGPLGPKKRAQNKVTTCCGLTFEMLNLQGGGGYSFFFFVFTKIKEQYTTTYFQTKARSLLTFFLDYIPACNCSGTVLTIFR